MPAVAAAPRTVASDPRVGQQQAKLDGLRHQLQAANSELEALQSSPRATESEATSQAAAQILAGQPADDAIDATDKTHEITRARQRVEALTEAVRIQSATTTDATRLAANELRESARDELHERLTEVATSVQTMLAALVDLNTFLCEMSTRGAPIELGHYRPVLGPRDSVAMLTLPQPEQASRTFDRYRRHVLAHLPAVAAQIEEQI